MELWIHGIFLISQSHRKKLTILQKTICSLTLKTLKRCSPSSDECWADTYTIDGNESYLMLEDTTGRNSFIAASGYSVFYWLHGANGAGDGGWFWIDINGSTKTKQNR